MIKKKKLIFEYEKTIFCRKYRKIPKIYVISSQVGN